MGTATTRPKSGIFTNRDGVARTRALGAALYATRIGSARSGVDLGTRAMLRVCKVALDLVDGHGVTERAGPGVGVCSAGTSDQQEFAQGAHHAERDRITAIQDNHSSCGGSASSR
jgi:hypothetical protein